MNLERRRGLRHLAVPALAALVLTGCSDGAEADSGAAEESGGAAEESTETLTVAHAQGETEVPADPQTVAVFDMGALDTLDTLGVDIAGLPKANIPSFHDEYDSDEYTDIGTLFEPDYEALARLDPDLVVVGFRSAAAYPELAERWPTVDVTFEATDFLAGHAERAEMLGEVFGKEAEVEQHLADLDAQAEEVAAAAEDVGEGLIVSTSGGEVTLYGADSRFGIIHTVLGVPEAVTGVDAAEHGEAVSFEVIRDADPDWLFVNDRDAAIGETSGQAAEQILDNELVASTTAWQEDQVVYLDGERWYIVMHGLSNVAEMFDEVGQALGR